MVPVVEMLGTLCELMQILVNFVPQRIRELSSK